MSVPPEALSGPTINAFVQLQDNYIPSVTESEVQDATEVTEQEAFLDAVMATEVMQLAEAFLQSKSASLLTKFYFLTANIKSVLLITSISQQIGYKGEKLIHNVV